jgi:tol-pal system beta propeller repeat protein TolB
VFTCQVTRDRRYNQICLMWADGSNRKQLTSNDQVDHFFASLAPDGESVVFSSNLNGIYQIYEMNLSGSTRLLSKLGDAYAPEISPDGNQIVFTIHDGTRQSIWRMDRDGNNPVRLTDPSLGSAWDPVWSPEGSQILFASDRSGDIQLYRMAHDGSEIRRLTSMNGLRGRNDWSPGGTEIATYAGTAWNRELYLIDLGTGFPRQITDGGNNLAPSYSPDGAWLTFTSYLDNYRDDNGCEIYIMRVDGTERIRLTENDYCDWQPRWGP